MIFNINGIEWKIVWVEPNDEYLWVGNGYTLGVTDLNTKTVYIANDLDYDTLFDVLLHEIVHCHIYSYNFEDDARCDESMAQFVEKFGSEAYSLADRLYMMII